MSLYSVFTFGTDIVYFKRLVRIHLSKEQALQRAMQEGKSGKEWSVEDADGKVYARGYPDSRVMYLFYYTQHGMKWKAVFN